MFDIKAILDMAKLPSVMKVESRMGDATVAVVDTVVKQIETTIANESTKALIQEKTEKVKLIRETLGLGPKEAITAKHIADYKTIAGALDQI